jgi:NAD(P) transhydrogenase subunit beta
VDNKLVLIEVAYILSAVLFMFGLKRMAHPRTAVQGNLYGAMGMLLAVGATLLSVDFAQFSWIVGGLFAGGSIGLMLAYMIQMTAMPQLVAGFNGFGGLASVIVAGAMLLVPGDPPDTSEWVATVLSGIIGSITFLGSMVAFGKLQELEIFKKTWRVPFQHLVNFILLIVLVVLSVLMIQGEARIYYLPIVLVAALLGVLLVNPIGGADMPVVIALLNSYSGLAASATGFVISNNVLIISGSLVGASGIILTRLMCKAMNRSLISVLFGTMKRGGDVDLDEVYKDVRQTTAEEVAMMLEFAQRVVVVPGYGMAVAQAQHAVQNLGKLLEQRGSSIEYAIHPVAGRMPGHMNVLLAEADVDYEKLIEMDQINPTMESVDVAIVIGANDVVNPSSRTDEKSPIYKMPIIDVDKARSVIVIKRSLSPGFAGVANPLFAQENTSMLFGDGKQMILEITSALRDAS